MKRALVLTLIILSTVAASLPVGDALVEAARRSAATRRHEARRHRRHTRAWRRRQRARLRRQRVLAAERRRRRWAIRSRTVALRRRTSPRVTLPEMLKQMELSSASPSSLDSASVIAEEVSAPPQLIAPIKIAPLALTAAAPPQAQAASTPQLAHAPQPAPQADPTRQRPAAPAPPLSFTRPPAPAPTTLPRAKATAAMTGATAPAPAVRDPRKFSPLPVPQNWRSASSSLGGEFKFSLRASDGRPSGVAVWSRLNLPAAASVDRRNRALAGVPHASLRRTVIDRMLVEGGWVVNDFEREIAGQKVFVVVAQSEQGGARRSWAYYFVEVNGQLFSLATTAPSEFADSVASDAEQTLAAIASRPRPAAAGAQD
ncbi:MAG TPA: hypothetical protein VM864_10760 [Pyrinomonadaceae bacterium]|jgi:hypothetical protein|nr:hypothetical protein [Pyrinomonadaceae bacterium]